MPLVQTHSGVISPPPQNNSAYTRIYICMYICIYAVELLSGPSLGVLEVIIWSKFVFYETPIAKEKHYKNSGFSTFVGKNCARTFLEVIIWSKWVFFKTHQLGPDNNFQLGPDNNFQNRHFFVFFALKNVLKYLFLQCFFENQEKLAKKMPPPPKNDNFFTFCKTQVDKKNLLLHTHFLKKIVFFLNLHLSKRSTDLEQKQNLKSDKKNKDKEREFERKKKRGNQHK